MTIFILFKCLYEPKYILIQLILLSYCFNNTYQSFKLVKNKYQRFLPFKLYNSKNDADIDYIADKSGTGISLSKQNVLDILTINNDELVKLRGTPELVDKLENLASKYPGIESNLNLFRILYPFSLDQFQIDGLMSLMNKSSVLVSTPTGSGKTVVGELAIYYALMMGLKVAYTTPLKALSNQKYQDFKNRFGADRVGLLTGDIAINRGAPITIMTTEVFRNIIYDSDSESQLSNLFMVCFDEFHFMNDPDRGTVWEESVISCPSNVRILALSATMGNVEEIRGWISSIHGPTDLIISNHRPVPLRYLFAMKQGLMPLFRDPNAGPGSINGLSRQQGKLDAGSVLNPSIIKLEEQVARKTQQRQTRSGRPFKEVKVNPNAMVPRFSDVTEKLQKLNLLPAIIFIFSRVGCEDAAKQLLQAGLRLLNDGEINYVNQAINAFAKANPEIPVSKASVQMLRSGVGVHHAGLIPVWKAFIEDLFNANKIKVLFATETLAAGVNMPARTTVISTVTKRVSSEIIKLKTSQLLQMAGRAGRRGKDDEGTVVVVKNRFEDSRMSHKILTSPVDDIKSHFKTSYGLTVKLLETRDIAACKSLIERGFGSYLLQQRLKKKETDSKKEVEVYRTILRRYTLKGARDYYKWLRRYEKEKRTEEFLIEKLVETENDLVQAIADYMPLGVGLLLRNGESGFFLGDVNWGVRNENKGFGVLTNIGKLYLVQKEHIRCFADTNSVSITISDAQILTELISLASDWQSVDVSGCKHALLQGVFDVNEIILSPKVFETFNHVKTLSSIPLPELPGSVIRQQNICHEIKSELSKSEIFIDDQGEAIIQALQYAATLKDPVSFVDGNNDSGGEMKGIGEVFAWKMFQNVLKVLQQFEALNGTLATELGWTVGSLSGDNELWLALVLRSPSLNDLNEAELGAVMSAIVIDGYKASNAFFKYPASDKVQNTYDELEKLSWNLKLAQADVGLEFPINLCREVGGIAESWSNGISWRELCRDTSLDQGDVCRILRRTVEILRQIPQAWGISPHVSDMAVKSANKMDRFPIAELDVQTGELKDTSGVGFSAEGVSAVKIPLRDGLTNEPYSAYTDSDDISLEDDEYEKTNRFLIGEESLFNDDDSDGTDDERNGKRLGVGIDNELDESNIFAFLADDDVDLDYNSSNESEVDRKIKRLSGKSSSMNDKDPGGSSSGNIIPDDYVEDLTKLAKEKYRLKKPLQTQDQTGQNPNESLSSSSSRNLGTKVTGKGFGLGSGGNGNYEGEDVSFERRSSINKPEAETQGKYYDFLTSKGKPGKSKLSTVSGSSTSRKSSTENVIISRTVSKTLDVNYSNTNNDDSEESEEEVVSDDDDDDEDIDDDDIELGSSRFDSIDVDELLGISENSKKNYNKSKLDKNRDDYARKQFEIFQEKFKTEE